MPKVHLVYENHHLMNRDINDFESYWIFFKETKDRIEYHVGLDFVHNENEMVIFDEVDSLMFADPEVFRKLIYKSIAIGFTASPDNMKTSGIERGVVHSMTFT